MSAISVLQHWLLVFGMSMLPIVELKGAILYGVGVGLDPAWVWVVSVIGSTLPCVAVLLFSRPVMRWMRSTKLFKRFVHWIEDRAHRKSADILKRKSMLLGLFIFVAIPLPTTGVWTGSLIASLLDIRIKYAFPVIAAGNVVAGILIVALGIVAF